MEIDNSAAASFRTCPYLYMEKYLRDGTGLERQPYPDEAYSPLDFGTRIHEFLEEHYQGAVMYPISDNDALELEAQMMMDGYRAHYPNEQLDIVDVERTIKVALPELCPDCYSIDTHPYPGDRDMQCADCGSRFNRRNHIFTGKMDLVYRKGPYLMIRDHKTQQRSSKSNLPQKWAARDQCSLYIWAAHHLYGVPYDQIRFEVNVIVRQSPAGQIPASFPDLQILERTETQIETAVRDLVMVADDIEKYRRVFGDKPWPADREQCYTWGQCEFYLPHTYSWSDEMKAAKFQPKKEYLNLGGIPIFQPAP